MMRRFGQWARRFSRPHLCVGVDIGSSAVKIVQLERRGPHYRIRQFGWRGLEPEAADDASGHHPRRLKAALMDLIREMDLVGSPVAMSVSGPSVMVKRVRLSGVKRDALDEYLTWEGHQYIPYAMRDVYFDYWVFPPSRHGSASPDLDLLLVAAKQQVVDVRKTLLEEIGVRPMVCDVDGLALMNMMMEKRRAFRGRSFGVVNVGAGGMNIVLGGQHGPLLVRDVSFEETSRPVQAVEARVSPVNDDADHRDPRDETTEPGTPPALSGVVNEVQYCLESTLERYPELGMEKMFLCGGQSRNERLQRELQKALSIPTSVFNPFDDIESVSTAPHPEMAHRAESAHLGGVALGLALHRDCHGEH